MKLLHGASYVLVLLAAATASRAVCGANVAATPGGGRGRALAGHRMLRQYGGPNFGGPGNGNGYGRGDRDRDDRRYGDRDRGRDRDDRRGGGYNNGGNNNGGYNNNNDGWNNLYNPLANRLGLGQSGASCIAYSVASSGISPGGGASSFASANSFSISGGGLSGLASCGASAQATAQTLACRRFSAPYPGNLCSFSGQFGSDCNGLQVINPGVSYLTAGQEFNVPPCNFNSG